MKIESKDTDIESLLVGSYFHIPRFQRPYSWDDENLNDFWNDVVVNQSEDYFIGSMVVFKKEKQHFGVVDGQQRLTPTVTVDLLQGTYTPSVHAHVGCTQVVGHERGAQIDEVLRNVTCNPL